MAKLSARNRLLRYVYLPDACLYVYYVLAVLLGLRAKLSHPNLWNKYVQDVSKIAFSVEELIN